MISSSDLYEREGKSQHAFCARIGREYPYDVRVLANVRPDSYWMDTMLHEFGHAVYDRHVNPRLPYLLRTCAHANTTEAIALMMGALVDDRGWLRSVAGAVGEDLEEDAAKLSAHRRVDRMILARFVLVMYHFEQALYDDPDRGDLNSVWWDLVERFLFVDRPPGRRSPTGRRHPRRRRPRLLPQLPDWGVDLCPAQKLPGVPHNARPLLRERGGGPLPLESFFGPGARENWRDTVLRATGEPLNPSTS